MIRYIRKVGNNQDLFHVQPFLRLLIYKKNWFQKNSPAAVSRAGIGLPLPVKIPAAAAGMHLQGLQPSATERLSVHLPKPFGGIPVLKL
ncbi:hypothetical protein A8C56_08145 [Niabella ginsenosidivorans]|uniref:Uncharacterized protein n=1 Tax=Niabella ginsenosidivorans TaxID=1176587 RepID=A0A1A9HZX4_9BACT|nr:hypothetical protein A8C56_08145 [Niabella ginsenosidivorans]